MIGVVLRHHRWNVTERDRTDTILLPKAHPIPTIKRPKDCNIREPRISERRNALGERERLVIPLSGDPGDGEVGQPRIAFLPKPADSHGLSLAFQVRQVPAMLDGRERLTRPWHRSLEQTVLKEASRKSAIAWSSDNTAPGPSCSASSTALESPFVSLVRRTVRFSRRARAARGWRAGFRN